MASTKTCDVCGRPAKFVKKLFLAKYGGRNDHSNYTHHADVGECCIERIDQIRWQKRQKREKPVANVGLKFEP